MEQKEIVSAIPIDGLLNEVLLESYWGFGITQESLAAQIEIQSLERVVAAAHTGLCNSVAAQNLYRKVIENTDHASLMEDILPRTLRDMDRFCLGEAVNDIEDAKLSNSGGTGYSLFCSAEIGVLNSDPYYLADVVDEILEKYAPKILMIRCFGGYSGDMLYIVRSDSYTIGHLRNGEHMANRPVAYVSFLPLQFDEDDPCSGGMAYDIFGLPSDLYERYIAYANRLAAQDGITPEELLASGVDYA